MMFRSRAAQTTILAAGSALALITVTAGDRAHAEGNLDASYTISFARIPVGEITATAVFVLSLPWTRQIQDHFEKPRALWSAAGD
jgi:hypothetical protein